MAAIPVYRRQSSRCSQRLSSPPEVVLPGVQEIARFLEIRLVMSPDVLRNSDVMSRAFHAFKSVE